MKAEMPDRSRRRQAGFTLLMAVFMVAVLLITVAAVAPNVLTEGRREKEKEMVWRGEQYERAIGLYYRKFGKYPTKVEDLTRVTNGVRFLRQAYTDPMNKDDGSWRFIYIGPNGQLIGSVKQTSLLQNSLSATSVSGLSPFGASQPLSLLGAGASATAQTGAQTGAFGANGPSGAPGTNTPGQSTTNPAAASNPLESQPQPLDGTILGGNIIGVGSKIKKSSIRVYLGGDTYQQWEFIWNPVGQMAPPGQQSPANPNANPTAVPGATTPNGLAPNASNPFGANPNGINSNGATPNGMYPNTMNPNPTDGQQPSQNPQTPNGNVPPSGPTQ